MNASALATRMAIAIQNIEAEVKRLGGEVSLPSGRSGGVEAKQCLTLEAIAAALRGIGMEEQEPEPVRTTAKTAGKRKGL